MSSVISRRKLLTGTLAFTASNLIIPRFGVATPKLDKKVALYNIHTGEWFKQNFVEDGEVQEEALEKINHFMRDHRNGKVCEIDPKLIHLLHRLQQDMGGVGKVFDVLSGYRSPETNAMLRRKNKGVAKNSYHIQGCAVDIKLPKQLRRLTRFAKSYKKGGVGYYPKSGFVHVDVRGKPVYWGAA